MSELGELCLWAALPLALLAGGASIAGAWTRHGELAVMGGRAAEATFGLLLLATVGLAYAFATVQLEYTYVAYLSGFQMPLAWRLAASWSGPGGSLALTLLLAVGAALSYHVGRSARASARTGCLAALVAVGLLAVIVNARPFAQSAFPAAAGSGLSLTMRDLGWQLQLWASYLATASAAFAFAGAIGAQLVESEATRSDGAAVRLVAALAGFALAVSAWRAYAGTGRLFDAAGGAQVAVHLPVWLVAIAYLHAPGGPTVPSWVFRWRRILGVALFPTALGGTAALLVAGGGVPSALPWGAGFGVGIVSGALAGLAAGRAGFDGLTRVPGFGLDAALGGLVSLCLGAFVAVWWLIREPASAVGSWPLVAAAVVALGAISVASVARPAGRWRAVWAVAAAAGLGFGGALILAGGRRAAGFAPVAAIAAAVVVGVIADLSRVTSARRRLEKGRGGEDARKVSLLRARSRRRLAAAVGHLGLAFAALGLAAGSLARSETQPLSPGDSMSVAAGGGGEVRVTYLGLSRYEVDDLDRRVASFLLRRGDAQPELLTAALTYEWISQRQRQTPGLARGLLRDHIVELMGVRDGEDILCRLTVRPLAGLVWVGGVLLLVAFMAPRGRVSSGAGQEEERHPAPANRGAS